MSNFMGAVVQEFPLGYIFEFDPTGIAGAPDLSTPEKVHNYFGYGTWERYGTDRVTVGAGGDYAAGSMGGEATHKLTAEEIAYHVHIQYGITSDGRDNAIIMTKTAGELSGAIQPQVYGYKNDAGSEYLTTGGAGDSAAHNNLQPYIANYRYRRIA